MTDRYRVYTKVRKTLKSMIKNQHPGHVLTLAMMIAGIVLGKKAQLSEMAGEIPVPVKDKSIEMRMRRWVKHPELEAEAIYLPVWKPTCLVPGDRVMVDEAGDGGKVTAAVWLSEGSTTRLQPTIITTSQPPRVARIERRQFPSLSILLALFFSLGSFIYTSLPFNFWFFMIAILN